MEQLTTIAQRFIREGLVHGDTVIDATAGNGWDTLFLAKEVGTLGKVYAFDIQVCALLQTEALLSNAGHENVLLINGSHEDMTSLIPESDHGRIARVMLNLGYLPGGNKEFTTKSKSTLKAIELLKNLLQPRGRVTIITYPGHASGEFEANEVERLLQSESIHQAYKIEKVFPAGNKAPRLYLLEKCL
jgi:16S rRNA C1402 N4-methylase RsmH